LKLSVQSIKPRKKFKRIAPKGGMPLWGRNLSLGIGKGRGKIMIKVEVKAKIEIETKNMFSYLAKPGKDQLC